MSLYKPIDKFIEDQRNKNTLSKTRRDVTLLTEFLNSKSESKRTGAPDGGVPQNICSAVEIQLAGKLIIAADFSWEFRAFSSISSRAGWIFQKTERDWKNTLVGTSCKRHFVKTAG